MMPTFPAPTYVVTIEVLSLVPSSGNKSTRQKQVDLVMEFLEFHHRLEDYEDRFTNFSVTCYRGASTLGAAKTNAAILDQLKEVGIIADGERPCVRIKVEGPLFMEQLAVA